MDASRQTAFTVFFLAIQFARLLGSHRSAGQTGALQRLRLAAGPGSGSRLLAVFPPAVHFGGLSREQLIGQLGGDDPDARLVASDRLGMGCSLLMRAVVNRCLVDRAKSKT